MEDDTVGMTVTMTDTIAAIVSVSMSDGLIRVSHTRLNELPLVGVRVGKSQNWPIVTILDLRGTFRGRG